MPEHVLSRAKQRCREGVNPQRVEVLPIPSELEVRQRSGCERSSVRR